MVGLMPWKLILLTWKKTLDETDKVKYQESINSNKQHLDSLKGINQLVNGVNMQLSVWSRSLDHKTKS